MIEQKVLDSINELPISEVIGQYIELQKSGNQYKALSPFSAENTPSFYVNDQKGVWKDFSSGESGKSAIDFLKKYMNYEFPEAVKQICQDHGITYQETENSEKERKEKAFRAQLYELNNATADFYHHHLYQRTEASDYFYQRNFSDETLQAFHLGYAPGNKTLINELRRKQFSDELVEKAGLVKSQKNKVNDFFKDRVMFPIHTHKGGTAGFAGRSLDGSNPKYMNSPETDVYEKKRLLYGIYQTKKAMLNSGKAIVVEGYTDVLKVYQEARQDVVATCGTAFTTEHAYFLAKKVDTVYFCFDADKAGINAFENSLELALKQGLNVKKIDLDQGYDPDTFIDTYGGKAFNEAVNSATDGILFYAERLAQDANDNREKGQVAQEIMSLVKLIPDANSRYLYVNDLAKIIGIDKAVLKEQLKSVKADQVKAQKNEVVTKEFWTESQNKETGEVKLNLDFDKFYQFLTESGYYLYNIDGDYSNEDSNQFIHLNGKIATPTNTMNMSRSTLHHLELQGEKRAKNLINYNIERYFTKPKLKAALKYPENLPFNEDDETTAYLYFNNAFVEITPESIETKGYDNLHGYIWRSHMRSHDFEYKPEMDQDIEINGMDVTMPSDFMKFIWLVATGKGGRQHWPRDDKDRKYNPDGGEIRNEQDSQGNIIKYRNDKIEVENTDLQKFFSFMTAIGYLVTSYKNPSEAPAIVAVDSKQPESGEPNGRTGKSLMGKAISQVIQMVTMDSRNFKFDDVNAWENVNLDTKVIMFNDTPPKFPFDRLFGMITEGMYVKKMYGSRFFIPFDQSPKFYINTNYVLKGEGDSNMDRQFILEFSDYFSSQWRPEDEFGRSFFYDWDTDEWNRFYSFIAQCVKMYLNSGLHPFPISSYEFRKLLDQITEPLFEFFEENITLDERIPKRHIYNEGTKLESGLYDQFIEAEPDFHHMKLKTFTQNLKKYCQYKGYALNPHKNGGRDKIGGADYITVKEMQNE